MISKIIRDALYAQLSDSDSGLNPRLATLAEAYGVEPYIIDWSNTSFNFLFGQVNPDQVEASSILTYPLVTIDSLTAVDQGIIFSATFSGTVTGIIEAHHSWPDGSVLADFSSLVDMTEEGFIACLKDPAHQNWGANRYNLLLRKGGISTARTRPAFGGENWRQSLRILCVFELAI